MRHFVDLYSVDFEQQIADLQAPAFMCWPASNHVADYQTFEF